MEVVERFESMLAEGADSPSLRFALGAEYLKIKNMALAIKHLEKALAQDPEFSAAWKLLARSQEKIGLKEDAIYSYSQGIKVATENGDIQATREMKVFLSRLQKA
ncbi:MAG: hypothetical protein CMM56_03970 [Rhodospirillaceae bacterium]|nr:hypothetical protein [Rhodospirillaceae bacterium]|tara:strand:+ start:333 stop:647 length:315 start_codon:yes stop_codon:yes gene_type:complete